MHLSVRRASVFLALPFVVCGAACASGGPEPAPLRTTQPTKAAVTLAEQRPVVVPPARPARVVLAAVGDVLLHDRLQDQALGLPASPCKKATRPCAPPIADYASLWPTMAELFAKDDFAIANLEGAIDGDKPVSSYPLFNYDPGLAPALKQLGIGLVSTANNHALDARGSGAAATLDALDAAGVLHTGTRAAPKIKQKNQGSFAWGTVAAIPVRGSTEPPIRVGFVACTFASDSKEGATNGVPDPSHQVLNCDSDRVELRSVLEELRASSDLVVVLPHWGLEYEIAPSKTQKRLAQEFVDGGASLVLGSHPHVPQPAFPLRSAVDGHEALVVASLGNFVSHQVNRQDVPDTDGRERMLPAKASAKLHGPPTWIAPLVHVTLVRRDGVTTVEGFTYTPLRMHRTPRWHVAPLTDGDPPVAQEFFDKMYGADKRAPSVYFGTADVAPQKMP